jgi:hypothetical protein
VSSTTIRDSGLLARGLVSRTGWNVFMAACSPSVFGESARIVGCAG